MFVSELLDLDHLLIDLRAMDKRHALQELSVYAGAQLRMPSQVLFEALQKREELGSTGIGRGFALPHARVVGLDRFFALFARFNKAIAFEAVDEKPVDLIFMLLMPARQPEEHVGLMASICRLFRADGVSERIRKAKTPVEIMEIVLQGARSIDA